jgi:EmrB/QacA subfamily drug resistance transporter
MVAVLCVGSFAVLMDTTIVNVALPSLIVDLHAGLDEVLWINNSYLLVFGALLIMMSRFGDIFGTRRLFVWGLVLFGASSALCGVVQNPGQLIAARALLGVGAAMMSPQPLVMISAVLPPQGRGAAMGVFSGMVGFAAVLGPTVGGLLVSYAGWRWIFFVNVPIVLVAVVLSLRLLPDLRLHRRHRIDWVGLTLATVGLLGVVFGVIEGSRYDWGRIVGVVTIPEVIGAGVLVVLAFFWWEWRQRDAEPLVPLTLFRDPALTVLAVLQVVVSFVLFGQLLLNGFNLQTVLGMSAVVAGLTGLPLTVTLTVVAPFVGRLADRIGGRPVVTAGFLVYALGILLLSFALSLHADSVTFILPLAVMGLGMSSLFGPITTEALHRSPPDMAGALSGVLNTSRQLGSVIGAAVVGALLSSRLATAMQSRAATAAAGLPTRARRPFVDAFAHVAQGGLQIGRGQSGGPRVPPNVTGSLAAQVKQLIHTVFVNSYVDAMRWTLYVLVGLLVLSAVASALFLRRTQPFVTIATSPGASGREHSSQTNRSVAG